MGPEPLPLDSRQNRVITRGDELSGTTTADGIWTLRDYVEVVRRRWRLVLLIMVLVPTAAFVASMLQQKRFQATANVLLSQENLVGALTGVSTATSNQPDRTAATQADVAASPIVAARAVAAAGAGRFMTASDLLDSSSVSARPDADVLVFRVESGREGLAIRLVNTYANAYVAYRQQLDSAAVRKAEADLIAARERAAKTNGVKSALYASLTANLQRLSTIKALQTSNAMVYRSATHAVQVQPRTKRNVGLAEVLGILLALSSAFAADRIFGRPQEALAPGEIAKTLGLSIVGYVPWHSAPAKREVATLTEPEGADAETFRQLRTALELIGVGDTTKSIMITSGLEAEGKSNVAVNLAVSLSRTGKNVVLVDLDLRRPAVAEYFGLKARYGIADAALGRVNLDRALIDIRAARARGGGGVLRVLPAGRVQRDVGELVLSPAVRAILRKLQNQAELLIVDVPPLLPVADGLALGSAVDSVAVVCRPSAHSADDLVELRRILDQIPADKLGLIVTEESPLPHGYGYGYAQAPVYPQLAPVKEVPPPEPERRPTRRTRRVARRPNH